MAPAELIDLGLKQQVFASLLRREGDSVRARRRECVEDVDNADDLGKKRDFV